MAPKRRPQRPSHTAEARTATSNKKPRLSKLAQANDLSAEEEAEIREAFQLFAQPFPPDGGAGEEDLDDEYAQEGILATKDVRRAFIALGLPPSSSASEHSAILSALDPTGTGYATYGPFVAVCALKLQARTSTTQQEEIEAAFRLFTAGGPGPITVAHLARVAAELGLAEAEGGGGRPAKGRASGGKGAGGGVGEEVLRDMILEANGGAGVKLGVGLRDFEDVMRRAGAL
ncbi:MAG: centrin, EF-hand protein [Phylliscum demangeonii]|nr:MAG: centrin, EF-hand protein [Phylliscum demangeonii]